MPCEKPQPFSADIRLSDNLSLKLAKDGEEEQQGRVLGVAAHPAYIEKYDVYLDAIALQDLCGATLPVIYGHDQEIVPFGDVTLACSTKSDEVTFDMQLDMELISGTSTPIFPIAHQTFRGIQKGRIPGVSLGLKMLEFVIKDDNVYVTSVKPYELSITPWPVIEGALVRETLSRNNAENNNPCPCALALMAELDKTIRRLSNAT